MRSGKILRLGAVALVLACGDASSPMAPDDSNPQGGSTSRQASKHPVVINEVMADPVAVADDPGEWIELYNWGSTGVDLEGWVIHSAGHSPHKIKQSVVIEPGGYLVVGREADPRLNGGVAVDYVVGGAKLKLSNGSDWVVLRDEYGLLVDSVGWTSPVPAGASRMLKDAGQDNSDLLGSNWVTATTPYGAGDLGTPGRPNEGQVRPNRWVVISEVMADPVGLDDDDGEWIELHNWGTEPVDIAGWSLLSARDPLHVISTSLVIEPGGYVVIGREAMPERNGGVAVDYVVGSDLKLSNAADWVKLMDENGQTVDSVAWNRTVPAGASRALVDPVREHADLWGSAWVTSTTPYSGQNLGTPGGENEEKPAPMPTPAAVIINELFIDALVVDDDDGEWFELHNWGTEPVDLLGWELHSGRDAPHVISTSLVIEPGGYVVLARQAKHHKNGGVEVDYEYGYYPKLSNSNDWLVLKNRLGETVDSVAWSDPVPEGASRGVINPGQDNSDLHGSNWKTSTLQYGNGDRGTPGAPNDEQMAPSNPLVVKLLDVGHGDAIYIENGESRVIIDGGISVARFRRRLDELGIRDMTLDAVILTHTHDMHYAGLLALFESDRNLRIRYVFDNMVYRNNKVLNELRDSIRVRVGREETVYRDGHDPCGTGSMMCTFVLDGGARMHILSPDPNGQSDNNRSIAVKLVGPDSASFTMWLPGDAEHEQNRWFEEVAQYHINPGMKVDVLKANHHGDCDAIDNRILDLVSPAWVVIPVGADNGKGLVPTQTKDLLRARGIKWYRNDVNGTITIFAPGTPGSGYSISVERGVADADGPGDATLSSPECQDL